ELDEFETEGSHGAVPSQALHPGEDVVHPTLQRRRQPPLPPPVGAAGRTVARVALPPGAATLPPVGEPFLDLAAAMGQLRRPHHPPCPTDSRCPASPSAGRRA